MLNSLHFVSMTAFLALFCISIQPLEAANIETIRDNDSESAIVFVHGLEGSAALSFQNQEINLSWGDLIALDHRSVLGSRSMATFDVYAVDYSDVFVGADTVRISVEEISQQVAIAIESHGLLRDYNQIWFVAHSLGGIVVKRVLIKWSTANYDRYLDRVVGVSLLGVPSNGSPLANFASSDYGELIARWLGYNAQHINDLKTIDEMNTFLRSVENDWSIFAASRSIRNGLPLIGCAYETKADIRSSWISRLFGRGFEIVVVPEIYTKTSCDGVSVPIVKTHIDLPKPSGEGDPIEDWLYADVRRAFGVLDRSREIFERANEVGALFYVIKHINQGHQRVDPATGLPFVDEVILVKEEDQGRLRELRLEDATYTGATWANIFEKIADANECVEVEVSGLARREIRVSLRDTFSCADGVYVCEPEICAP